MNANQTQQIETLIFLKNDLSKQGTLPTTVTTSFFQIMDYIITPHLISSSIEEKLVPKLVLVPKPFKGGKAQHSKIKVAFLDNGKTFFEEDAKNTFIASLKELDFARVRERFPAWFRSQSESGTDMVHLGQNLYLVVGLSNHRKKVNLEKAARVLGRKMSVEIILPS